MVKQTKVIVEKHPDGYVAYPLGLKGVLVGEGDTYEEALADVRSAIAFHIETFGPDVFEVVGFCIHSAPNLLSPILHSLLLTPNSQGGEGGSLLHGGST